LNFLTSRRIFTVHLHILEGITQSKQWVVIGSATNAIKEAVVTRTILANLTSAQKEITTNAQHAIPALFCIITQLTNICQPCWSSSGSGPQRSKTVLLKLACK
jgi:hypothetical protein